MYDELFYTRYLNECIRSKNDPITSVLLTKPLQFSRSTGIVSVRDRKSKKITHAKVFESSNAFVKHDDHYDKNTVCNSYRGGRRGREKFHTNI